MINHIRQAVQQSAREAQIRIEERVRVEFDLEEWKPPEGILSRYSRGALQQGERFWGRIPLGELLNQIKQKSERVNWKEEGF